MIAIRFAFLGLAGFRPHMRRSKPVPNAWGTGADLGSEHVAVGAGNRHAPDRNAPVPAAGRGQRQAVRELSPTAS